MQSAPPPEKLEELIAVTAEAAQRWLARQDEVVKNRSAFAKGVSPETDERLKKSRDHLLNRVVTANDQQAIIDLVHSMDLGKERILNEINDLVSVEFFERGIEAALSVGRIDAGLSTGTGFLVGPNILLTNHHVLGTPEEAQLARFDLDAEENRFGSVKRVETFCLCPDKFWATSKELDFTFVAVELVSLAGVPLSAYGWHPLIAGEGKIRLGEGVSIIQHPRGQVKMVALHNAQLVQLKNGGQDDAFCFYSCDTDRGSSGSPVFNALWEVIALHHASVPEMDGEGKVLTKAKSRKAVSLGEAVEHPEQVIWMANEGVRVSRLVAGLEDLKIEDPAHAKLRNSLLALWQQPDVMMRSRPHGKAEVPSHRRTTEIGQESHSSTDSETGDQMEIPMTLSIRFGNPKRQTGE